MLYFFKVILNQTENIKNPIYGSLFIISWPFQHKDINKMTQKEHKGLLWSLGRSRGHQHSVLPTLSCKKGYLSRYLSSLFTSKSLIHLIVSFFKRHAVYRLINCLIQKNKGQDWNHQLSDLMHDELDHRTMASCLPMESYTHRSCSVWFWGFVNCWFD